MADLFSEIKRIKAQLKGSSPEPAAKPTRTHVAPVPGLPQVTPLRKPQSHTMPDSLGNRDRSSSASGRDQAPGRPLAAASNAAKQPTTSSAAGASRPVPAQPSAVAKQRVQPTKEEPLRPAQVPIKRVEPVPSAFRPLAKGALTRQGLFRQPEAWLGTGGKTQCYDAGHRRAVDIVIGLDFGTSYTKAAVGFRDKIFPVTWDGISRCVPDYLLPSEFTELEDGSLFVGQHSAARTDMVRSDLKLPFINSGVSSASIGTASTFVALVLRYVRAWVYHHHAAKLGHAKIRWQLNVGAPSNGLETSSLVRAYRTLAATAWLRSLQSDPLRLAGSSSALWRDGEALPDLVDFQIRPEFVAQMAGYMQSPQRQRGLHALVDVGGGTLDVVTFIVHRVEDEDTFPFLVPQVHPLGTHGLIQNRLLGVGGGEHVSAVDELAPIAAARAFARLTGIAESHVRSRDALLKRELSWVIKSVFETTKSRRYRLSEAWLTGVRTFFTGGGSQVDLYREAVTKTAVPSAQGLHLIPLPPHKNLDGFSGGAHEYQRVSVACGLAQDAFTLGRIVPAREVEDDRAVVSVPSVRADRPDRDELYPK
jgi:hypothetical protein